MKRYWFLNKYVPKEQQVFDHHMRTQKRRRQRKTTAAKIKQMLAMLTKAKDMERKEVQAPKKEELDAKDDIEMTEKLKKDSAKVKDGDDFARLKRRG